MPFTKEQQQLEKWSRFHAALMLLAAALTLLLATTSFLAFFAIVSLVVFFYTNQNAWQGNGFLGGIANWITLARIGTIMLLCLLHAQIPLLLIGALALLIVASDGLDGYLARKFSLQTYFGEYFDKETDAFYVFAMSLLVYDYDLAGCWILLPGLLRYWYVLALIYFKPPQKKESRSFKGQTIAVVMMISLGACFILPTFIYLPALVVGSLLIVYSFTLSFLGMVKK